MADQKISDFPVASSIGAGDIFPVVQAGSNKQANVSLTEITANKSTNTALGTSNTLYPSQNAVKSYVDSGGSGSANASLPTGTTSTSGVMMGFNCTFTPTKSGRVILMASGTMRSSSAGVTSAATLNYGTGTPPTNGAAATGASLGSTAQGTSSAANELLPFALIGFVTNLSIGTTYWLDIKLATSFASGTAQLASTNVSAIEI
jgi:hypothetical protein